MAVFNGVDQGAVVTGITAGSGIRIKFTLLADYVEPQIGYACVVDGRATGGFLAEHANTDPTLDFVGGAQLLVDDVAATFLRPAEAPTGSEVQIYAATGANVGTSFNLFRQANGSVPLAVETSVIEVWDDADTTLLHRFTIPDTLSSLTIADSIGGASLLLENFTVTTNPILTDTLLDADSANAPLINETGLTVHVYDTDGGTLLYTTAVATTDGSGVFTIDDDLVGAVDDTVFVIIKPSSGRPVCGTMTVTDGNA
jgi:hypothetical protein